jgi:hypothetical protein
LKKVIFALLGLIIYLQCFSQERLSPDTHEYVTEQSWELLKYEFPWYRYSEMNNAIGNSGETPPQFSFQRGKIVAGSYIEDEEEIMYDFTGWTICDWGERFTSTHFWDADVSDIFRWNQNGICSYPNALMKAINYWNGTDDNGDAFLWLEAPAFPFIISVNGYNYRMAVCISYSTLDNAFKDPNNILVEGYGFYSGDNFIPYEVNPPQPIIPFLLSNTIQGSMTDQEIRKLMKKVIWEIVGRICHLIEDQGVPAHVHNDPHPIGGLLHDPDTYEHSHLGTRYSLKNWQDALAHGGHIDLNNVVYPLRTIMYTLNQISDRFPSDDCDGDGNSIMNTNTVDRDFIQNQIGPIYERVSNIPLHWNDAISQQICDSIFNNSYIYSIRAVAGFLNFVYNKFGITYHEQPIIEKLTQNPPVICPGTTGYIICNMEIGEEPISYNWVWENKPANISCSIEGNRLKLQFNDNKSNKSEFVKPFKVSCKATNNWGTTDYKVLLPVFSNNCNTCPFVFVMNNDTCWVADNNILHKSKYQENIGHDITDRYILNTIPQILNNKITIKLAEIGNDSSIINSVKLYAIDHNYGTISGITEDNDIVIFDSIGTVSANYATLCDNLKSIIDVTKLIQYDNDSSTNINGESGFNLNAQYSQSIQNRTGIIINIGNNWGNPINICNLSSPSGLLHIISPIGSEDKYFSKRLNNSLTILTANQEFINNPNVDLNIEYYSSFNVQYVSLSNLRYSDYIITELPFIGAENSIQGNVSPLLFKNDTLYSYISPNGCLDASFINISNAGSRNSKRDYLLEVEGKILSGSGQKYSPVKLNNNHLKKEDNIKVTSKNLIFSNYPNPFNPSTKIHYKINTPANVSIIVYDILGRIVKNLVNEYKRKGDYIVEFDGSNLSSGVYFYKFDAGSTSEVRKLFLVK